MTESIENFTYLIIGGGIAGITCAETIYQVDQKSRIGIITASNTVKKVTNLQRITKLIEDFNVVEAPANDICEVIPTLSIIKGFVQKIISDDKTIVLNDNSKYSYQELCICTGGKPNIVNENDPNIIGIRDTDSVKDFKEKLKNCRRVIVLGNGGIASEIVYEISNCEVVWVVRDKTISSHLLDSGAARFLLSNYTGKNDKQTKIDHGANKVKQQRHHYSTIQVSSENKMFHGGALGPDWAQNHEIIGKSNKKLEVIYEAELRSNTSDKTEVDSLWSIDHFNTECPYKLAVELTNGQREFCDLIVSATGVLAQYPTLIPFKIESSGNSPTKFDVHAKDGSIKINENMQTNIEHIYAAGDCCFANWKWAETWFQMKLWSQARHMAFQAGRCMVASVNNEEMPWPNFSFELFTHVTKLFGYSIVLLGRYNDGHGKQITKDAGDYLYSEKDIELWIRTTDNQEYLKLVVLKTTGRVIGATLIGDTEMSETIEDLILDEIDVSRYKEAILDPDIDIVDYFD